MTIELYRADPYRTSFDAIVVRNDRDLLFLDQTLFVPYGRGTWPSSDNGSIGPRRVIGTIRSSDGRVGHQVEPLAGDTPELGRSVSCLVDWPRRFEAMRQHTAGHLLEAAVRNTHQDTETEILGWDATGTKLQLAVGSNFELADVSCWLDRIIHADLPMTTDPDPMSLSGWTWHLDGVDHAPCDALHVHSTGEIGRLTTSMQKHGTDLINLVLGR